MPQDDVSPTPLAAARRRRSVLNQAQLKALDTAAQIAATAKKEPYKAALKTRDIAETLIGNLDNALLACRNAIADAVESDTAVRLATTTESDARKALLAGLREVQTAARQKFARTRPEALKDYYIGEKLGNANRATLVQIAEGILQRLADQSLPGITPETIAALRAQRTAYTQANADQSGHAAAAKSHRDAALAQLKIATDLRLTVQFAADALYPFDKPASAPARTEFALPARRRLTTP
jgi:hypothetical protein